MVTRKKPGGGSKKATPAGRKPVAKPAPPAKARAAAPRPSKPSKPDTRKRAAGAPEPAAPRAKKTPAPPPSPAPRARRAAGAGTGTIIASRDSAAASKLGRRWACYRCAAKFYDLGRPEPRCPKCGADQRERPKESAGSPPPPPAPRRPRPMVPLLEDDDDAVRYDEEFDLGIRDDEGEAAIETEELFPGDELEEPDDAFEEE